MAASDRTEHDRYRLRREVTRLPRGQAMAVIALLSALSWGVLILLVFAVARSL